MKLTSILVAVAIASTILTTAHAANMRIGGETMTCSAAKRFAIDNRSDRLGLADVAARLIILNKRLLQSKPRYLRRFVFLHECGHLNVGHSEVKADCWAVKRASREGWFKPTHLD
ncbi:MAG: hypothetical protein ACR2O4_17565, partial [Hyphomicrobiaceae bacterium]